MLKENHTQPGHPPSPKAVTEARGNQSITGCTAVSGDWGYRDLGSEKKMKQLGNKTRYGLCLRKRKYSRLTEIFSLMSELYILGRGITPNSGRAEEKAKIERREVSRAPGWTRHWTSAP